MIVMNIIKKPLTNKPTQPTTPNNLDINILISDPDLMPNIMKLNIKTTMYAVKIPFILMPNNTNKNP